MQCIFLRRKYPEPVSVIPTLADLWDDMSIVKARGFNSYQQNYNAYVNVTELPNNQTTYIFSMCNGYLGIWKVVKTTIISSVTKIKKQSSSYGGIYLSNSTSIRYYSGDYTTGPSSGTQTYGATLVAVQFPSYSDEQVDEALGAVSLYYLAGTNSSTAYTIYTNNRTHAYIFGASSSNFDILVGTAETRTKIAGTTNNATTSSSTEFVMSLGNCYGASIIGIDES